MSENAVNKTKNIVNEDLFGITYKPGKINTLKILEDHVSIQVDYDDGWSQGVSFDLERKDILKERFPARTKVTIMIKNGMIYGLIGKKGQFIMDSEWKKAFDLKLEKQAEEYAKENMKRMLAIPRYKYESKYQFPDDINIYGGNLAEDGEGFRNSAHLSVSRGMEFMEGKDLKDFSMKEYRNIGGITENNKNVDKLQNHIDKCVMKELGSEWGHSGMSMILATSHVLKAKELGWEGYINQIREDIKERKGENKK